MKRRKDGQQVWEFRFYDPDAGRKRRAVCIGSKKDFPTESAVRRSAKAQMILLRINGERRNVIGDPPTFGALIARYEEEEMPARHSTRSAYSSNIRQHIQPRWGAVPISDIKVMAVQDWLKRLALAAKTKAHIRSLMSTMFKCAMRWELTDKNPMELVSVAGGTKRQSRPQVITPDQFGQLTENLGNPYRTMVLIAGCLGLRVSEIMGLKWDDFDFQTSALLVQRSVVHGRVGEVKTEYSKDVVPLDPDLVELLKGYRDVCYATPEGWLFANPQTGRPYHQDQIQKTHIQRAAEAAGIEFRMGWHTFRHSYRSWLGESGASLATQKELMRHADIRTTMNVYGRVLSDTMRKAHSNVVQMILPSSRRHAKGQENMRNLATGS